MKRAGYKCRKCGSRATQVHHETYKRIGRERLSDLTAVCGGCHRQQSREVAVLDLGGQTILCTCRPAGACFLFDTRFYTNAAPLGLAT